MHTRGWGERAALLVGVRLAMGQLSRIAQGQTRGCFRPHQNHRGCSLAPALELRLFKHPQFLDRAGHPILTEAMLLDMPTEIVFLIILDDCLTLEDTYALGKTCKRFALIFQSAAKDILKVSHTMSNPKLPGKLTHMPQHKAPGSLEARKAQTSECYAAELRRLVKRREAISSVNPFLVARIADTECWIYENGVLCHVRDRQLRILNLHESQSTEIIIDI